MLKIAIGFVHHFKVGERILIFCNDFLKIIKLVLVYDTDQNGFFSSAICSNGVEFSTTVMKLLSDFFDKIILTGGDNGEFVCRLGCFK